MHTILVTGANGLLGTNTIYKLIEHNFSVIALVRDKNKFIIKNHPRLKVVEADLGDTDSLQLALKNCDYIVHTAAETRQGLKNYASYAKVNVAYTENLLRAAVANKVKRFIHVSTCNVFGFGSLDKLGNENTPIKAPYSESLYVKSKLAAQNLARTYAHKIDVVFVNPTFIIGAYDQKPSSGRIILMGYQKRFIFCPPGGKNFVAAPDVAQGIVKAIAKGKNKESYILSGDNLTYKAFFSKLNEYENRKPLFIQLPPILLLTLGRGVSLLNRLGFSFEANYANMQILCVKNYYSHQKAERSLGVKFQAIDTAIAAAIAWFKKENII